MANRARRASIHAALGESVRLAVVDDLAAGDRSPSELARRIGVASNLIAHHLDVLERAGVVQRFVSSGDQRRRYVRLVRAALTELELPAAELATPVVFVCTRNTARSQLAAALWRRRTGTPATSAGTHPAARIHARTFAAARRRGLEVPAVAPRRVTAAELERTVVTVCDRAHEELDVRAHWLHWSIADPVERDTDEGFDAVLDDLDVRIRSFATVR